MGIARKIKKSPGVEFIERYRLQLNEDYKEIEDFKNSEMFAEFNELDVIVHSNDFLSNRKSIEKLSYKRSELYHDEKLYKKLASNKKIKIYLSLLKSEIFKEYTNFSGSDLHIKLNGYKTDKPKDLSAEDKERMSRYFQDEKIKAFYKFEKSKEYRIFKEIDNSLLLKEYNEIKGKVNSDKFINHRSFLVNKDRYRTTDDYVLLQRYNDYAESAIVRKYLKYIDSDEFKLIEGWDLVFEEGFNDGKLDLSKWTCVANKANEILNSNVSLLGDKHFYNNDNNISLERNCLSITTVKNNLEGLYLDPELGLLKKPFDYSSGIVTSQGLFATRFGKFEAKIRMGDMSVNHCFWLAGENKTPHIDIIKSISKNKSLCSLIVSENNIRSEKIKSIDFAKGYYLFTLIWSPDKIEWMINDVKVWEQISNIPVEPMSIYFSSSVYKDLSITNTKMFVDWLKVYEKVSE
jgi:beta-glucanase (GH16 family)